jgi:hypothetical protein
MSSASLLSSLTVSRLLQISSTGVQTLTLIALASLWLMKSSVVVYLVPLCHTVTCECVISPKISEINPQNDSWRRIRRAAHQGFTKVAVRGYHPILGKETIILSSALLQNPDSLEKHLQRFSASAIMSILYDYPTLKNEHDKTLTEIHAFIDRMSAAATPGTHLVELFPWMIHIPDRCVYTSSICLFTECSHVLSGLQGGSVKGSSISSKLRACLSRF